MFERHFKRLRRRRRKATRRMQCPAAKEEVGKGNRIHGFFFATPCVMWDLTALTRDPTCAPCSGRAES